MRNQKHKILTLTALTAIAAGVIHLSNRIIAASAQLKDMLDVSDHHYFYWRFGRIHYTKKGSGSPVLLIHDTMAGASAYGWHKIEKHLAKEHTVYTIDLLGCGRSEKPGITYTNFLFVQLLCEFSKKIIREKADIIASGFSSSFAVMSCLYDKECFNKLMLVNPPSLRALGMIPTDKDKLFKLFIEIPVFGTLIYHMIVSRETISNDFMEKYYYNPFHVTQDVLDAYYEAAHKGGYYAKYLYSSQVSKYMNINIQHALSTLDNSIFIIEGEEEINGTSIVEEYCKANPAIEVSTIDKSKHFPHLENEEKFMELVGEFL